MKTVTPRIEDVLRVRYASQQGYLRRFKRYWGVTTVQGVEVLNFKKKYYKRMDPSTVKLTKMLGVYNDLQEKPKGVDSAWLYLNPAKAEDSEVNWDKSILVRNLNKAMDRSRDGVVCIGPKNTKRGLVAPVFAAKTDNSEELKTEAVSRLKEFWDNNYQISSNDADPYVSILQMYLLRSKDIPYNIEYAINATVGTVKTSPKNPDHVLTDFTKSLVLYVNYEDFVITDSTDIVSMITEDMKKRRTKSAEMAFSLAYNMSEEYDVVAGEDPYEAQAVITSDFWIREGFVNWGGKVYLKASFFSDSTLKGQDKVAYLNSCIDSGYRKKKTKAYVKIIAIVIIIAAFYFAGPAGGAAATSFTSAAVAAVVMVAVTVTVAAMYIRLAMLASYYLGAENLSMSLGTFLKQIAPLLKVAEVISLVAVVYSLVDAGIERATAEAVKRTGDEAAKATIKEIVIEITKIVIESLTGIPLATDLNVQHVTKMLDISFGMYSKNKKNEHKKRMENYRKEIAELEAAREQSQVSDVVKDMMRVYPNPINIDQSVYADRYDRPYEWWATPYHSGNIQATTVNALWLS